jgi:hypothetical protein
MNSLFRKYWYLTVVAVFVFASASFAQTTQITLTNVGDNATVTNSSAGFGVYVDPYVATIGTGASAVSTYAICDDWSDNTSVGETWTANVNTLSPLSGTPLFASSTSNPNGSTTPGTLYNELAWLGTQLLASPTDPTNQVETSFAIWELTYGYAPTPEIPGPTLFLSGSSYAGDQGTVNTLMAEAAAAVKGGYSGSGWEILTPVANTPGPPQEFLVYTPESSAAVVFGADMVGLLGLVFVFRRRLLRPIL